jgi:hypothetical protein
MFYFKLAEQGARDTWENSGREGCRYTYNLVPRCMEYGNTICHAPNNSVIEIDRNTGSLIPAEISRATVFADYSIFPSLSNAEQTEQNQPTNQ